MGEEGRRVHNYNDEACSRTKRRRSFCERPCFSEEDDEKKKTSSQPASVFERRVRTPLILLIRQIRSYSAMSDQYNVLLNNDWHKTTLMLINYIYVFLSWNNGGVAAPRSIFRRKLARSFYVRCVPSPQRMLPRLRMFVRVSHNLFLGETCRGERCVESGAFVQSCSP